MEVNTLVKHKTLSLGIGCVSKVLKRSVKVNFGFHDVKTCKPEVLEIVDTTKCEVISMSDLRRTTLLVSSPSSRETIGKVIIGNEIKEYVGIGFVTINIVTENDLKLFPRVVSDEEIHRQRGKIHGKKFGL